jgi:transcription antitermination factor NusB
MQALFQLDVQGEGLFPDLDDFFKENAPEDAVRKLAIDWTRGTWANLAACDELITNAALKWKLSRLSQVDKSILRLAVYQLKFCADIPPKVTINEAIEIAKKFGTDKSPGFVNGVLDGILKKLQPAIAVNPVPPAPASHWQGSEVEGVEGDEK